MNSQDERLEPLEEEPSSPEQETHRLIPHGNDTTNLSTPGKIAVDSEQSGQPHRTRMAVLHHGRAAMGRWEQSRSCIGAGRNRKVDVTDLKECSVIGLAQEDSKMAVSKGSFQRFSWDPSRCAQLYCMSCVSNGKFTRIVLDDVVAVKVKKKRMEIQRLDGSSLWFYDVEPDTVGIIREAIVSSSHARSMTPVVSANSVAKQSKEWCAAADKSGPLSTLEASSHSPQGSDYGENVSEARAFSVSHHASAAPRVSLTKLSAGDKPATTLPFHHDSASDISQQSFADRQVGSEHESSATTLEVERIPSLAATGITVEGLQADAALVWSPEAEQPLSPSGPISQLDESFRRQGIAKQWRTLTTSYASPNQSHDAVTHSSQNTTNPTSFGFTDTQIKEVIEVAQRLQHEPLQNLASRANAPGATQLRRRSSRMSQRRVSGGAKGPGSEMQLALEEFDKYIDETKTEKAPPALIYGLMRERGHGVLVANHVVLM